MSMVSITFRTEAGSQVSHQKHLLRESQSTAKECCVHKYINFYFELAFELAHLTEKTERSTRLTAIVGQFFFQMLTK